jgi:hypothetical protein
MIRLIMLFAALIISGLAVAADVQEPSEEKLQSQQQEQIREKQTEQDRLTEQERIRSEQSAKEQERTRNEYNEPMRKQESHHQVFPETPVFQGGNFGSGGGGHNR